MKNNRNLKQRQLLNACAVACVIGCVNEELGEQLSQVLEPFIAQGQKQLIQFAASIAVGSPVVCRQRGEEAVSKFLTSVIERTLIGGFDPAFGSIPEAFFCQAIRHAVYHTARWERGDRERPLEDSDDTQVVIDDKLVDHDDILAMAKRLFAALPPGKAALIKKIYPFLDEDGNGERAPLNPAPPKFPSDVKARALQAFLYPIQKQLDLPKILPAKAQRAANKRLKKVKRRRHPKA